MKAKLIGLVVLGALSCGTANAVVLTSAVIANTTNNVGLITTLVAGTNTPVTGTAYVFSTSTALTVSSVAGVTTLAGLQLLITNDPGSVRSVGFTAGALASSVQVDFGAVGNKTYLWLQSTDGSAYGLYSGIAVPSSGAVTFNSATSGDLIGTSVYSANGTSGFQLVSSVPEPSAALLGALGVLGLLRRRRI